ncbi:MAG: hypothetical protein QOE77_1500 [Blastocatellia bacterium]|jgi:outer membrane biosynthesis protein TonB|nr:hypothetical protein [Blastocatellia bacterium]
MDVRESLREAQNLRFRFQMNRRLRLECLAAVSKVFREQGEPISDELLSTIVFALPQELVSGNGRTAPAIQMADDKEQSQVKQPGNPPDKPKTDPRPGNPPYPPRPQPGNPPEMPKPGNPPEQPKPAVPPEQPAYPIQEPDQPSVPPEEPEVQQLQAPGPPPQPDRSALSY